MRNIRQIGHSLWARFLRETSGAIILVFAVTLPVLVGLVGLATDSALAYLERERLSRSCDAASLAAASSSVSDNSELYDRFISFFEANYPPNRYGSANSISLYLDGVLVPNDTQRSEGDVLRADIEVSYAVTFARIFGVRTIDMMISCEVQREIRQLEVAMVLDVTGSMVISGRIRSLREASTSFVNILFDRVPDDSQIRIALVPYAAAVNVGDEIINYPHMFDPPVDVAALGAPALAYDRGDATQWHGCVLARDTPHDYEDAGTSGLNGGPWQGYLYPDNNLGGFSDNNNYVEDDGVSYNLVTDYRAGDGMRTPNLGCPSLNPIQPLSSDREMLLDLITGSDRTNGNDDGDPGLRYWSRGGTLGNIGMAWGERVLSPQPPFTQGADYDDPSWRKAVVMMTDGENQIYRENYSSYGPFAGIGAVEKLGTTNRGLAATEANRRFNIICENLKNNNVTIYTIVFGTSVNRPALRQAFESCASDSSKFFPAPSGADLEDAFQRIARELSNLHLRS